MPAPLYHSGPLRFAMTMQHVGATLVVMEKFDAAKALELCQRHRVTDAHWVPTMLVRILKLPVAERDRFDLSSLTRIIHGAGPIAPEVKREFIDWIGPILEESYGGTEGNGMTMISSAEWLAHPGSVGRAFVGSIHVLDDAGRELPPGETGLIYFAGGPTFEYHGNPQRTRDAYDAQGRSTLGDIGYLDAEGYLYLTDRKHNMIITGGVNVFPQEIENVLITHPQVLDIAVFGLPDVEMGEVIQAVVQPRDLAAAGPALELELIALVRAKLAHYKAPRCIDFRAELPRHDTGKIYTRLLKAEYLAKRRRRLPEPCEPREDAFVAILTVDHQSVCVTVVQHEFEWSVQRLHARGERQGVHRRRNQRIRATLQHQQRRRDGLWPVQCGTFAQRLLGVRVELRNKRTEHFEPSRILAAGVGCEIRRRPDDCDCVEREAGAQRQQSHHAAARIAERIDVAGIDLRQRTAQRQQRRDIALVRATHFLEAFATIVAAVLRAQHDIAFTHEPIESELRVRTQLGILERAASIEDQ